MKIPQLKIWQNASGTWSVAYTDSFDNDNWLIPARAMQLPAADYIKYVIQNYSPSKINGREDGTYVGFYWDNYTLANKFKLDMNKIIRQKNFKIS